MSPRSHPRAVGAQRIRTATTFTAMSAVVATGGLVVFVGHQYGAKASTSTSTTSPAATSNSGSTASTGSSATTSSGSAATSVTTPAATTPTTVTPTPSPQVVTGGS